VAAVTRGGLFAVAGMLALGGLLSLFLGIGLLNHNVKNHVSETYRSYGSDADGRNYECSGSPRSVADDIAAYDQPEARASDRGSEYLRYSDDIVIVGPDGARPCTVRVEDINARYNQGSFIYLGPGFYGGSPTGSSGGSPGGPDGSK
jgi:hypothetical protein